ncbi:MAG: hypothetical protein WD490_09430, partial [Opitutales bacterium]
MGQQQAVTGAVQAAAIAGDFFLNGQDILADTLPLLDEPLAMIGKGNAERLQKCGDRIVPPMAEGQPQQHGSRGRVARQAGASGRLLR